MYRHHLEVLKCFRCGAGFCLDSEGGSSDYIEEGSLRCENCDFTFPIKGGVPRFNREGYASNFSVQWKQFVDFEKFYDVDNYTYYFTGLGLTPSDVADKRILEIGCGNGRAVGHFLQGEPELFVAIDLSEAVDIVEKRFKQYRNLLILQCDMASLPLEKFSFDVVYSYGVIHHTPDPKKYFSIISQHVVSGGLLAIWVYIKGRNFGVISNFIRRRATRFPHSFLVLFCWLMTLLAYGLYLQSRIPIPKILYGFNLHVIRYFFRITPSRHFKLNYLWAHDFHTTKYTSEHTPMELYEWYDTAGFYGMKPLRLCGMIGRKK